MMRRCKLLGIQRSEENLWKPHCTCEESLFQSISKQSYDYYVTDIKWHRTHPAVFASVDGSDHFDIWNLNIDTEVPAVSTIVSPNNSNINNTNKLSHEEMSNNDLRIPQAGLNKLAWDRGGISTSSTSTRAKSSKTAKTTADLDSKTKTTTTTKDGNQQHWQTQITRIRNKLHEQQQLSSRR